MAMKLLLTEDVPKLGRRGDIVTVKPGFARNFLIPQGMGVAATADNMRAVEAKKKKVEASLVKEREEARALADRIGRISLTIPKKVGENDVLYGSVTTAEIQAALEAEGVVVDRRKIVLDEPIKSLGVVNVPVKVHADVQASVKVWVVKE